MDLHQFVLRLPPELAVRLREAARREIKGQPKSDEDVFRYVRVEAKGAANRGGRSRTASGTCAWYRAFAS